MRINKEILDNIDILETLNKYNVEGISSIGDEVKFRCPLHDDKTPSAFINKKTKLFKCFGCGAKGNIITLISKLEKLPYYEVVHKLLLNTELTEDYQLRFNETKNKLESFLKKDEIKTYFEIYKKFIDNLPILSKNNYLTKIRKISEEIINRQGIRLFNKKGILALREYKKGDLLASGLFKIVKDKVSYIGTYYPIVIPFYRDNKVVGLQLRRLGDEKKPKYLNIGSINCPYNVNEVKNSDTIFICEGVIDCLTLLMLKKSAIALIGAMNFKEDWAEYLIGKNVKILLDNDDVGKEASKKLKLTLEDFDINVEIIRLKEFNDINEWFMKRKNKNEI